MTRTKSQAKRAIQTGKDGERKAVLIYQALGYEVKKLQRQVPDIGDLLVTKGGVRFTVQVKAGKKAGGITTAKIRKWLADAEAQTIAAECVLGGGMHPPDLCLIGYRASPSEVLIARADLTGALHIQDLAAAGGDPRWLDPEGSFRSWEALKRWVEQR